MAIAPYTGYLSNPSPGALKHKNLNDNKQEHVYQKSHTN